jgi:hypothetical protein
VTCAAAATLRSFGRQWAFWINDFKQGAIGPETPANEPYPLAALHCPVIVRGVQLSKG